MVCAARCQYTLRHCAFHSGGDVLQLLALAQPDAHGAVARQVACAGEHNVANACQARKGERAGARCNCTSVVGWGCGGGSLSVITCGVALGKCTWKGANGQTDQPGKDRSLYKLTGEPSNLIQPSCDQRSAPIGPKAKPVTDATCNCKHIFQRAAQLHTNHIMRAVATEARS